MKRHLHDYSFVLGIASVIILLDQLTKLVVRTNLPPSGVWAPWDWLLPYARIVNWQNTGAAFGMLQGRNLLFSILAVIVSIAILYYYPQVPKEDWLIRLALAMQLGGAVGNLIDRIQFGAVTDFVSVGGFAVFNVADACISIGTVLLILGIYLREQRLERTKQATLSPDQTATSSPTPSPDRQIDRE